MVAVEPLTSCPSAIQPTTAIEIILKYRARIRVRGFVEAPYISVLSDSIDQDLMAYRIVRLT